MTRIHYWQNSQQRQNSLHCRQRQHICLSACIHIVLELHLHWCPQQFRNVQPPAPPVPAEPHTPIRRPADVGFIRRGRVRRIQRQPGPSPRPATGSPVPSLPDSERSRGRSVQRNDAGVPCQLPTNTTTSSLNSCFNNSCRLAGSTSKTLNTPAGRQQPPTPGTGAASFLGPCRPVVRTARRHVRVRDAAFP